MEILFWAIWLILIVALMFFIFLPMIVVGDELQKDIDEWDKYEKERNGWE